MLLMDSGIIFLELILIINVKVQPLPSTECTWIQPPIYSHNFLHILNPNPAPYAFKLLEDSTFENILKSLSMSLGFIPIPVSDTSTLKY